MKKTFTPAVLTCGFYIGIIGSFLLVVLFKWGKPEVIPFELFQFWFFSWDWNKLQQIPWSLLLIGPGLTLAKAILTSKSKSENREVINSFQTNVLTSVLAGTFEEVAFRWLGFYVAIFTFYTIQQSVKDFWSGDLGTWISANFWLALVIFLVVAAIANFVLLIGYSLMTSKRTGAVETLIGLGLFLAVGLADLIVLILILWSVMVQAYGLWIPALDWVSQGQLHQQLYGYGFAVGAGVVSVNWDFGDGHKYQGWFGYYNSLIIGLIMFWLMFNFGLIAAILVHAAYDLALDLIITVDANMELLSAKSAENK